MVIVSTRWGVGISPDSISYMRQLNPGIHAPLYSWVLAAFGQLGIPDTEVARGTNVLFLIGSVLLTRQMTFQATRSQIAALLAACLVLSSPQLFSVHTMALSEPLFVFLTYLALFSLTRFLDTQSHGWLVAAGVSTAFALMTRYAGAPLVAAGTIAIAARETRGLQSRLFPGALFAFISCAPMALWLAVFGNRTRREPALLGNDVLQRLEGGASELARLLLPTNFPASIRAAALLIVVGVLMLLLSFTRLDNASPPLESALGGSALPRPYCWAYLSFST